VNKLLAIVLTLALVGGGLGLLIYARDRDRSITAVPKRPKKPPPVAQAPEPDLLPRPAPPGDWLGVIIAAQTVDVAANLDGRLASVLVRVGDRVETGAAIATLDLRTLESDLALARAGVKAARADEAKALLEIASADTRLSRAERLGANGPAADIEDARSERKLAATRLESAKAGVAERQAQVAKLEVSRTDSSVRAPFAGVVAARYLDPGALVHSQTPIVRLISSEALRVRFAVPEVAARGLAIGKAVRARIPTLGTELRGIIETVAPEVDPAARMIFVEARLEDPVNATARPATGVDARVRPEG
jgi:RND family efflux transporter MFP subunit